MGSRVEIDGVDIEGVKVVHSTHNEDARGSFARWFCSRELTDVLAGRQIVQINYSSTKQVGAMRGLHFQNPPNAEMKLIRCLRGRVFDVVVDLRTDSPTFLRWHATELAADNARMVVIPEGFAHGFQVLEPDSELLYLHTAHYAPSAESGLRFDDPRLAIRWPREVTELAVRDKNHPLLSPSFRGIKL